MTTVVSIMMSDIVPLRERGTWQGILNIIYALGAGCGAPLGMDSLPQVEAVYSPVVGGLLADRINWRWYVDLASSLGAS